MQNLKIKRQKECKLNRTKHFKADSLSFGILVTAVTFLLVISLLSSTLGLRRMLILGSGLAMPEGLIDYVKKDVLIDDEVKSPALAPNHRDVISQSIKERETQEETLQTNVELYDIKSTPKDILVLMEKFSKAHKNDSEGGKIIEQTFTQKGATHCYKNIYVKNVTETKKLDIKNELSKKVDLKIQDKSQPTVLIFHTHTTEAYEILDRPFWAKNTNGRSALQDRNVVRVGDEIEKEIKKAGFNVIHDRIIHDKKYTGAYDHSRITVKEYLKKYPSIQVVLDVHRDAIHPSDNAKIKPVTKIDGKKAAQVMIITGAEEGRVKDFPDWEYNLRFALNLQKEICDLYPTLMRPILFSQRKYVMDLSHCNVLIEMGSDVNTLEEAAYSGRLIGTALSKMLEKYVV